MIYPCNYVDIICILIFIILNFMFQDEVDEVVLPAGTPICGYSKGELTLEQIIYVISKRKKTDLIDQEVHLQ